MSLGVGEPAGFSVGWAVGECCRLSRQRWSEQRGRSTKSDRPGPAAAVPPQGQGSTRPRPSLSLRPTSEGGPLFPPSSPFRFRFPPTPRHGRRRRRARCPARARRVSATSARSGRRGRDEPGRAAWLVRAGARPGASCRSERVKQGSDDPDDDATGHPVPLQLRATSESSPFRPLARFSFCYQPRAADDYPLEDPPRRQGRPLSRSAPPLTDPPPRSPRLSLIIQAEGQVCLPLAAPSDAYAPRLRAFPLVGPGARARA